MGLFGFSRPNVPTEDAQPTVPPEDVQPKELETKDGQPKAIKTEDFQPKAIKTENVQPKTLESKEAQVKTIETEAHNDQSRITSLQIDLENIKQERLRNNLRIIGIPSIALDNPTDTISKINDALNIDLLTSNFTAYADKNKSSIILSYLSYNHKRHFMDALKERKSLAVRDIFPESTSNSQIYVNDQLTPYFAALFRIAWKAKKDGKLFSVSSLGGKVRIRRRENDELITVNSETQLLEVINVDNSEATPTASKSKAGTSVKSTTPSASSCVVEQEIAPIRKTESIAKRKKTKRQTRRRSESANEHSETETKLKKKHKNSTGLS